MFPMVETPEQIDEAERVYREFNDAMNKAGELATTHKGSERHNRAVADAQRLWGEYNKLRPTTAHRPVT